MQPITSLTITLTIPAGWIRIIIIAPCTALSRWLTDLLTKRQHLVYFAITGLLALACGIALVVISGGGLTWLLLALGAFFVLFYTWPLKYIALGEIAVLIVWGPLMVGGDITC